MLYFNLDYASLWRQEGVWNVKSIVVKLVLRKDTVFFNLFKVAEPLKISHYIGGTWVFKPVLFIAFSGNQLKIAGTQVEKHFPGYTFMTFLTLLSTLQNRYCKMRCSSCFQTTQLCEYRIFCRPFETFELNFVIPYLEKVSLQRIKLWICDSHFSKHTEEQSQFILMLPF